MIKYFIIGIGVAINLIAKSMMWEVVGLGIIVGMLYLTNKMKKPTLNKHLQLR